MSPEQKFIEEVRAALGDQHKGSDELVLECISDALIAYDKTIASDARSAQKLFPGGVNHYEG